MKTQNEMRSEFEKFPQIKKRLADGVYWSETLNRYSQSGGSCRGATFVNGSWYAFQEQQKKIDAIVSLVWSETPDYDLDNKIKEILK